MRNKKRASGELEHPKPGPRPPQRRETAAPAPSPASSSSAGGTLPAPPSQKPDKEEKVHSSPAKRTRTTSGISLHCTDAANHTSLYVCDLWFNGSGGTLASSKATIEIIEEDELTVDSTPTFDTTLQAVRYKKPDVVHALLECGTVKTVEESREFLFEALDGGDFLTYFHLWSDSSCTPAEAPLLRVIFRDVFGDATSNEDTYEYVRLALNTFLCPVKKLGMSENAVLRNRRYNPLIKPDVLAHYDACMAMNGYVKPIAAAAAAAAAPATAVAAYAASSSSSCCAAATAASGARESYLLTPELMEPVKDEFIVAIAQALGRIPNVDVAMQCLRKRQHARLRAVLEAWEMHHYRPDCMLQMEDLRSIRGAKQLTPEDVESVSLMFTYLQTRVSSLADLNYIAQHSHFILMCVLAGVEFAFDDSLERGGRRLSQQNADHEISVWFEVVRRVARKREECRPRLTVLLQLWGPREVFGLFTNTTDALVRLVLSYWIGEHKDYIGFAEDASDANKRLALRLHEKQNPIPDQPVYEYENENEDNAA